MVAREMYDVRTDQYNVNTKIYDVNTVLATTVLQFFKIRCIVGNDGQFWRTSYLRLN